PAPFPIELRAERVAKSFGAKHVLADIDITIRSGEIVAIVGGSGSGKTVLLDTLIGLHAPSSGRVLAANHNAPRDPATGAPPLIDLADLDSDALDLLRLHWAVVFQRNALFSGSVRSNIALWLKEHTLLSEQQIDERVRECLQAVSLDVHDVIDKDRDALSGGMAKRVAIARAIACDPLVIFYDEPTTGLDPVISATIHELIWNLHHRPLENLPLRELPGGTRRQLNRAGLTRTSIIVTHDKELLRRLAPRVVMLDRGRICYDGPYERFGAPGPDGGGEPARQYLASMPVLHQRFGPPQSGE
ncbi:MAG TPA: ATP-binding cassette domain-containing protein, partial [Phycisphaerales bacterium]|nr:ATP-binding cassette domain-containing protein [Phycisphaerales bacterium]